MLKNYIIDENIKSIMYEFKPSAVYGQNVNGKWDKRISNMVNKLQEGQEIKRTKNLSN